MSENEVELLNYLYLLCSSNGIWADIGERMEELYERVSDSLSPICRDGNR